MKKTKFFHPTLIWLLIIFGFYLTLSLVSNTFDGDFGWHLRFGRDAWQGNFQYLDSYTWGYFGRPWINHEWGGDIFFYALYNLTGYFGLAVFISLALWASFLAIIKIFYKKFTPISILVALYCLLSIRFIIMLRLSMLSLLFFALLWWSLEKMPAKKTYYAWPFILWLWSFFHGSWILGFIVINIYLGGNILYLFWRWLKKKKSIKPPYWNFVLIKKAIIWQTFSALVIVLNPYGWRMWGEVIGYFSNSFYKSHINEWLPSYSYPVYWLPLVLSAICACAFYSDYYFNKKSSQITLPRLLLFIAFFISAMQYRRNNMYLVMICLPVLIGAVERIIADFPIKKTPFLIKIYLTVTTLIASTYIIFSIQPTIRYSFDVWNDRRLIAQWGFPVGAVEYLRTELNGRRDVRIFNHYAWGGYPNWTLPEALAYMDGRSAATWTTAEGNSLLAKYFDLVLKENQLSWLEQNQTQYILLNKNMSDYPSPRWSDKLLFNGEDLDRLMKPEPYQLEKDIRQSANWELVYTDVISNLWRIKSAGTKK